MRRAALGAVALLALAACTEKPQVLQTVKHDTAAFQGTGMPYVVPGWKAGDQRKRYEKAFHDFAPAGAAGAAGAAPLGGWP